MQRGLGSVVICVSFCVIASWMSLLAGCGGGKSVMPSAAGLAEEPRPSPVLSSESESVKLARAKGGGTGSSRGNGKINVTSTPSGGRIFLNGNDTSQVTPALLKNVPAGTATVTVRKDGYQDSTQTRVGGSRPPGFCACAKGWLSGFHTNRASAGAKND